MGVVVHQDRIGGCSEDGYAADEGECRESNPYAIEQTDGSLVLGLVGKIPRIDLEVGSRRRALLFE